MSEVLRIIEKFHLSQIGWIYTFKNSEIGTVRMGDKFFDLKGNEFEVIGIEMPRCTLIEGMKREDMPIGIRFKNIDKYELSGNLLVRNLNEINFIFCNHPLYQARVDEDYAEEYQAAGLYHPCALFSYEDLEKGKLSLCGETISGLTIYRGWMMKPDMYTNFCKLLEEKKIYLINTPEEYERYHTLPGWYEDFSNETIPSIWETEGDIEAALIKAKQLKGSYIVKDFVKSRKHEWYDACFIKDISDVDNALAVMKNFVERQGDTLTGGIALRQFVNLRHIGYHEKSGMPISEEYRVFVYAGKILMADSYWTKKDAFGLSVEEMEWIESLARRVKSNFVALDVARKEDGKLIIIEFGDGQVSGLQQMDVKEFYNALRYVRGIPIEELIPEGAVILASAPMPNKTANLMKEEIAKISNTQELVDAYVQVHNNFWYIEDDLYDYEEGTDDYNRTMDLVCAWQEIMDDLDKKVMFEASREGLLAERLTKAGTVKQLEAFMRKYGYKDGCGWWIKI